MNWPVAIVLALLVVLYVAFEYSTLRAKYAPLYSWYASAPGNPDVGQNIGPTRIMLGYERPWMAQLLLTRPIPQAAAELMIRLVAQQRIVPQFLLYGPGGLAYGIDSLGALKELCASPDTWAGTRGVANPLAPAIPFASALVQGYRLQVFGQRDKYTPADVTHGDLSLMTLWMHGYEEFIRQRFTAGATSVLSEWNYMFATDVPKPVAQPDTCGATSIASDLFSAGIGAAGVGAMLGAPEGGLGAVPGAIIGFFVGAAGGLLGKSSCLG